MDKDQTQQIEQMQKALQGIKPVSRIMPLNIGKPINEAQGVYQQMMTYGKQQNKQTWSEIDQIANACANAFEIINEVRATYMVTALHHFLPDRQLVSVTLKTLAQDTMTFASDLKEITSLHTGKTGDISDDELVDSIRIFELYVGYNNRFNQVIIPNATILAEEAQKAISAMREHLKELEEQEDAQAGATDPTVITDVEVKSV